jgi:pilus assembly protein CpaC
MNRASIFAAGVLAATLLALAGGSQAAGTAVASPIASGTASKSLRTATYRVPLYKSTVVILDLPAKRLSVGNPGVADIVVLRSNEVYVVGKALGSTNVVAWDADGRVSASFDVSVTHDLDTLKERLHELLPGEAIKVYSAEERLVLAGQISSLTRMDAALALATGFLPDCVRASSDAPNDDKDNNRPRAADTSCEKGKKEDIVNLMQVGGAQQVMLKVTVAEMARNLTRSLESDLNFFNVGRQLSGGGVSGGATFPNALDPNGLLTPVQGSLGSGGSPIGPAVDMFEPNTPGIAGTGLFLSYLRGDFFLQAVLSLSKRNGLAKILSEPTLTTLTGQEAQFVSGGEFPVPVPQGGTNTTTIEFKEFGVGVKFVPLVLESGRINLSLRVSVSDVSNDNSVALSPTGSSGVFVIPSLTKRSASSTVELADGQTIGIAGLINDTVREYVEKLPGLGDIPGLGALFRSQQFVSGQTELVIFVTPHLARPIKPEQIRLPTDGFVPPEDLEFYLLGRLEGRGKAPPRPVTPRAAPPPDTRFGHDL